MSFTTRPEIQGTFGVAASTHWLASTVAFSMLERGGNAFDAAVAGAFVLQVVEPHLNGPGGEVPIILHAAGESAPRVICGQGVAPQAATIAAYRREGLDLVPGSGLLAAVVPGAFDAWMLLLRDYGRLELAEVMAPAIDYARDGYPFLARASQTVATVADLFQTHWPGSAALYLAGGKPPTPGALFRNPALAATYQRIVDEAAAGQSRASRIERAREAFYRGFVAEEIERFVRTPFFDVSGERHRGVITADDLARWQAGYEQPTTFDYGGYRLCKTGPWGQGPVLLQQLALLEGLDLAALDPEGPEFVHTVVETMKLAFADREAYYGDPACVDVPLETLLGRAYSAARQTLLGERASLLQRPGVLPGFEAQAARAFAHLEDKHDFAALASTELINAGLGEKRGDTCHIDVVDRDGNMVSATPSGGWLQSSPVIPALGFPLGSRAQMFWLKEGLPGSLAPGKRPRTTLSPTLALRDGEPYMAFGTPGGDQQDQWQLVFFLYHAVYGKHLQAAVDAPCFHTEHFPGSFYPRAARPGSLFIEDRFAPGTIEALRARGHDVTVQDGWSIGRMCAVAREGGILKGAASPRMMQAYVVGR